MRPRRIDLGPWLPDVAPIKLGARGLLRAKNAVPTVSGYGPQPGLSAVSGYSPLAERPRGSITVLDSAGNPATYIGTQTKLYRLAHAGTEDLTRSAGAYGCIEKLRWEFGLFGEILVAVNPFDDPQYINVSTGARFARLEGDAPDAPDGSVGTAPRAYHVGLIADHLVFGNVTDPIFGHVPHSVWWPQIRNPFHWPEAGSDDAVAAQSDRQPLSGDAGKVQRVIGGAEVGVIFQEKAVSRMDYRGGDVIFQITRVEPSRGLLAPGLAIAIGRMVYFYAEDGWYVFDYTTSAPIGKSRIDEYFKADCDFENLDRATMAADPDEQRFFVLYPGAGNVDGAPNHFLCYDWSLRRWSHGEIDAEILVGTAYPAGLSLDSPDTPTDPDAVDTAGLPSFDDPQQVPGASFFGAVDDDRQLAQWTGAPLEAEFETGSVEMIPGAMALVTSLRPIVEGGIPAIRVAGIESPRVAEADIEWGPEERMDHEGRVGPRADGRYHRFKMRIAGGFDSAQGLEVDEYGFSGRR